MDYNKRGSSVIPKMGGEAMKLNPKKHTKQRFWFYPIQYNGTYAVMVFPYSTIEEVGLISPIIVEHTEQQEMDYEGEKLPFEFVEPLTDNQLYIKKLIGL